MTVMLSCGEYRLLKEDGYYRVVCPERDIIFTEYEDASECFRNLIKNGEQDE